MLTVRGSTDYADSAFKQRVDQKRDGHVETHSRSVKRRLDALSPQWE